MSTEALNIQTIGKYQVLGTLGRGSMGVVYKARDPEIGRIVAIKTLRRVQVGSLRDTDMALERFRNEARSAGNLRHPNIVTVFEVNRADDIPYLVMDFVEGQGLDTIIAKGAPLSPRETIAYASQIAAGLDYAHSKNVLHRDIKPSNIMVDRGGTAFVLDFGVATITDSYTLTGAHGGGPVLGTPGYMSPEQILNNKLTNRSDLFSFAAVIFECLSGKRPFPGETFSAVVGNILNGKPLSLTEMVPSIPLALEAEFERAFAKAPEDRFATAREVVEAMKHALGIDDRGQANSPLSHLPAVTRKRPSTGWRSVKPTAIPTQNHSASARFEKNSTHASARSGNVSSDRHIEEGLPSGARRSPLSRVGLSLFFLGQSPMQRLTFIFSIISLLLGVGLVWMLFGGSSSTEVVRTTEVSPPPQERAVRVSQERSNQAEPLRASFSYQQALKVMEMSDEQLLEHIRNPRTPEDTLLKMIESASERRMLGLVEALNTPLANDSYIVRVEAIKLLAALGDTQAVPELVLKLDDHDPVVRGHAAKALGGMGDRRAVGYLTARYYREEVAVVKSALKKAVEKLNGYPMRE